MQRQLYFCSKTDGRKVRSDNFTFAVKWENVMHRSPKGDLWRQSLHSDPLPLQKHEVGRGREVRGGGGGQYRRRNVGFVAAELLHVFRICKCNGVAA